MSYAAARNDEIAGCCDHLIAAVRLYDPEEQLHKAIRTNQEPRVKQSRRARRRLCISGLMPNDSLFVSLFVWRLHPAEENPSGCDSANLPPVFFLALDFTLLLPMHGSYKQTPWTLGNPKRRQLKPVY
jgi:hypothetical protein